MNPKEYIYTQEHEWVFPEAGNRIKLGITDYAQSQLGDIVFLDLPTPGARVAQFEKIGEIESVKAVSDLFAPVSGHVLEVNQAVIDEPGLVNRDPYGAGWLVRLEMGDSAELAALMSRDDYGKFLAELGEESSE